MQIKIGVRQIGKCSVKNQLLLGIMLVLGTTMRGQEVNRLTVNDGLSQGFVTSIAQDKRGFIWAGTLNGLNRYDGTEFKVFVNHPGDSSSVASNNIQALFTDSRGFLWVFSSGAIQVLDYKSNTFFEPKGLNPVHALSGRTTILLEDGALYMALDKVVVHYTIQYGESTEVTLRISEVIPYNQQQTGTIFSIKKWRGLWWLGTEKGLFSLNNAGTLKQIVPALTGSVFQIWEDKQHGYVCVQTEKGVYFLRGEEIIRAFPESGSRYSNSLKPIRQDGYYLIVLGSKVCRWDGKGLKETGYSYGADIICTLQDKQANLWFGVDALGLICLQNRQNNFQQINVGRPAIKQPVENAEGSLWIFKKNFVDGGGDLKFGQYALHDASDLNPIVPTKSIPAYYLARDNLKGDLWYIDKNQDLIRLTSEGAAKRITPICGIEKLNYELGVSCLPDGSLLLISADAQKIVFYNPERADWIVFENARNLLRRSVWDISSLYKAMSPNDYTWITGVNTIVGIKPDWVRHTVKIRRFNNVAIQKLAPELRYIFAKPDEFDRDVVWIGTWNGLFRWQLSTDEVAEVSFDQLTSPGAIFCMAQATPKQLWLGAQSGLIRFDVQTNEGKQFTMADGLPALEFNRNTSLVCRDGRIVMGTVNGSVAFYPNRMNVQKKPQSMVITRVWRGEKELELWYKNGFCSFSDLSFRENNLLVQFSMLDYENPKAIQYRFRFSKESDAWYYKGLKNTISLANLSPGRYMLEFQGSRDGRQWSASAILAFRIRGPWWLRWWVITVGIVVAVLGGWSIIRNRRSRFYERHQNELLLQEARHESEIVRAKEQILVNMAHELRTPVTLINGLVEDLVTSPDSKRVPLAAAIKRHGMELISLVTQILDLGRLRELGQIPTEPIDINLPTFIPSLISGFQLAAKTKKVDLRCTFPEAMPSVYMDEWGLRTIVSNLLSNALKFTPEGGRVQLDILSSAEYLDCVFKDSGEGIPEEEVGNIFTRYYQSDSSRKAGGTGIGLAYAYEMAKTMGGSLKYVGKNSEAGTGAVFLLRFPWNKIRRPVVSDGIPISQLPAPPPQTSALSKKKPILVVVEDMAEMASYIRNLLEPDYEIILAANGKVGLEKIIELVPDLVLSDVMMPEMSGRELVEAMRADFRVSHIPVILLTALAGEQAIWEGLHAGADIYVTKPFDSKTLHQYIENSLDRVNRTRIYFEQAWAFQQDENPVRSIAEEASIVEKEHEFITRVKSLIEQHYADEGFTMEQMAARLCISSTQLRRKIVALGGESASTMLRNYRLEKARQLLSESLDSSIAEVAFECGFSDPNYFSTLFSKKYGSTPSEYRRG